MFGNHEHILKYKDFIFIGKGKSSDHFSKPSQKMRKNK